MKKKQKEKHRFQSNLCIFAKNTAHIERQLLNYSYICPVADNPS